MNVALPALVLFAAFLPGIVYRRHATLAGVFRRERSLGDEALEAAIATACIHLPLVALIDFARPLGLRVDPASFLSLLAGKGGPSTAELSHVTRHPVAIVAYFIGACAIARVAARCMRAWELSGDASAQSLPTRFSDEPGARRWAEWDNLFALRGDDDPPRGSRLRRWVRLVLGGANPEPTVDVIALVAVVVELGREPYLYLGLLEDVRFTEDGRLDRIELAGAYRRPLGLEATPEEQRTLPPREERDDPLEGFYRVTGRRLILRAYEFKTMNLDYFGVEVVEAAAEEPVVLPIRAAA